MKAFKIRPSAAALIVGGSIGLSEAQQAELDKLIEIPKTLIGLTDKQQEAMDNLEIEANVGRLSPSKQKKLDDFRLKAATYKERTPTQEKKYKELLHKQANPEIPASLKSYCKKWVKEEVYGKKHRSPSDNKYTEKGTVQEDAGIELLEEVMGYFLLEKNEKKFSNGWCEGTPDVLPDDEEVVDIKCSWDENTFPLFEDEIPTMDYWWQLQCYMWLTGRKRATLAYCLVDTPDNIIAAEARKTAFQLGHEEVDEDLFNEVHAALTFSNAPEHLRVKTFEFERDEEAVRVIKERVDVCRDYIKNVLLKKIQNG